MENRYPTYPEIEYNTREIHDHWGTKYYIKIATSVRIERNGKFYFTDVVVDGQYSTLENTEQVVKNFHGEVYLTMLHFKPTDFVDRWDYPLCREDNSTLSEKDRTYYKYVAPWKRNEIINL